MKSKKQLNKQKEAIRNGLTALLRQNFETLSSYQISLDRGMSEEVYCRGYLGRTLEKDFDILHIKRDSSSLLGIMKRTGYFTDKELKKFTRKYSDLDEFITKTEQNIRKYRGII